MFDAVARGLGHGEHEVLFELFGQIQWSQPIADLSANRRQLMGIRRPLKMNEFSKIRVTPAESASHILLLPGTLCC